MKKEQKENVIAEAQAMYNEMEGIIIPSDAKVNVAPNAYWVQAWVDVPLEAAKS